MCVIDYQNKLAETLNKPMFLDSERVEGFFNIFPENWFNAFVDILITAKHFPREDQKRLIIYSEYKLKPTSAFKNRIANKSFDKFNKEFESLQYFLAKHFFVESSFLVLEPDRKYKNPDSYRKLEKELINKSECVEKEFKRLVKILIPLHPNITQDKGHEELSYNTKTGKLFYGGEVRHIFQKGKKGTKELFLLMNLFWDNYEHSIAISKDDIGQKINFKNSQRIREKIKNLNRIFRGTKIPLRVEKTKKGEYHLVSILFLKHNKK